MAERQRVSSGSPYEQPIGFSRAVRVGERVLVSGTGPVWPDGSCDPDPYAQASRCLEIALAALAEAGAGADDVVRTRMYVTDRAVWQAVGRAHGQVFGHVRPAATMVVVAGLVDPRWLVEIELEAILRAGPAAGLEHDHRTSSGPRA
jgi:enamine deaminase RidA (YjgF/YER057c/UK114 family)